MNIPFKKTISSVAVGTVVAVTVLDDNKTYNEVIEDDCQNVPSNFVFRDDDLRIIEAWCKWSSLTAATSTRPRIFIGGSPNSNHDVHTKNTAIGKGTEENNSVLGVAPNAELFMKPAICHSGLEPKEAKAGDAVFSPYADSFNCNFARFKLPAIAVVGGDNTYNRNLDEDITTVPKNAIFISHGANYGEVVEYYIPSHALSFALPKMTAIVNLMQTAVFANGGGELSLTKIKDYLNRSSKVDELRGEWWFGQHVDAYRAIELAIADIPPPIEPCPACTISVNYLLLLTD